MLLGVAPTRTSNDPHCSWRCDVFGSGAKGRCPLRTGKVDLGDPRRGKVTNLDPELPAASIPSWRRKPTLSLVVPWIIVAQPSYFASVSHSRPRQASPQGTHLGPRLRIRVVRHLVRCRGVSISVSFHYRKGNQQSSQG